MITPECTLAYAQYVFKPGLPKKPKPNQQPKYSVTCLFTPEALKTPEWQAICADVIRCAREAFGAKADTMIAEGAIRLPFRKDIQTKGHPAEYALYINCSADIDHPPAVLTRHAVKDGKPGPITDKREIYSGVKARVSVQAYAYGGTGTDLTPGVALGLGNIQKLGEGPRLGNRAEEDFGALPPTTPAPLGDTPAAPADTPSAADTAAQLAALMS